MSTLAPEKIESIIEAAIMVADHPLNISSLQNLFSEEERPNPAEMKAHLSNIAERYQNGIELKEVASGYRFQAKAELSEWLSRLWEERAPRYSRAFFETLAIIAYKQPITRAEIEDIRGVTVSSHIIKTLLEREWIRLIGYREIPGRPGIYGTTKQFLDYFNLKTLSELPPLAEIKSLESQEEKLQVQLALNESDIGPINSELIPEERDAITIETVEEDANTRENNILAFTEVIEDNQSEENQTEENLA